MSTHNIVLYREISNYLFLCEDNKRLSYLIICQSNWLYVTLKCKAYLIPKLRQCNDHEMIGVPRAKWYNPLYFCLKTYFRTHPFIYVNLNLRWVMDSQVYPPFWSAAISSTSCWIDLYHGFLWWCTDASETLHAVWKTLSLWNTAETRVGLRAR